MAENKTQIIRPGENVASMGNLYSPLIPFECLFDTDVGLIQIIRKEYRAGGIFNIDLMDRLSVDRRDLIYYLYTRDNQNPLLSFMIEPDIETATQLYQEFKEKLYDRMIEQGVFTGLFRLCQMFSDAPEVHPYVYYRNLFELNFLKRFESDLKAVKLVDKDYVNKNKKDFNQFYIKYTDDQYATSLIKFIDHKSIYILGYGFNFELDEEQNLHLRESAGTAGFTVKRNIINIIDAFDLNKLLQRKE